MCLFIFLTFFFAFFVSKLAVNTFDKEIQLVLGKRNLMRILLTQDTSRRVQRILYLLESQTGLLSQLETKYSSPSPEITEHNYWIYALTYTILVMFAILVFTITGLAKWLRPRSRVGLICMESLIIFGMVGVVEYIFFTMIAFKYNPAPPSLLIRTVLDTLRDHLVP